MKKLWLLLPVVLLLIISCDILNHDVYDNSKVESFFDDFSAAISATDGTDLSAIMAFYNDDYSNNLVDKAGIEQFYTDFFSVYMPIELEAVLLSYDRFGNIKWELAITTEGELLNTMLMEDIYMESSEITFFGNQINPPAVDPTKPIVFAEFFTGEDCGNCPPAASHLHHMKNTLGDQFIYVEYCSTNNYSPFYFDLVAYYNYWNQPTTIFGGTNVVIGGASANLTEMDNYYNTVVESELKATITNLSATRDNGVMNGQLDLELFDLSTEDLLLTVVIADAEPEIYYNGTDKQFHNVAFAKTDIAVTADGTINFSVDYDNTLEFVQPKVIVWLQTKKAAYDTDCKVHTAAEANIE